MSFKIFKRKTYKNDTTTPASEWKDLLSNAYIWLDFWSQPQPCMANEDDRVRLQKDFDRAIESVASYIERSDCMMILATPSIHENRYNIRSGRKQFTCLVLLILRVVREIT